MFRVRVKTGDECVVMALAGELDIAGTGCLADQFAALLSAGRTRIVLDLGALEFCDAAWLGVLIRFRYRAADEGGWPRLARR